MSAAITAAQEDISSPRSELSPSTWVFVLLVPWHPRELLDILLHVGILQVRLNEGKDFVDF